MHEIFDIRNLPWHAVQRSLADALAAGNSPGIARARAQSPIQNPKALGNSWLARAIADAQHGARRGP